MRNTLHYGDCLNVMAEMPDAFVDLIYLDPPFNSKSDYNIFFPNPEMSGGGGGGRGHLAQIIAFHDTWTWDGPARERVDRIKRAVKHPAHEAMTGLEVTLGKTGALAYLSYMAERLAEMKRLLKPTGSIYLHCDPTMSHYLKIVMDGIFGHKNFRNEIVWCYTGPGSPGMRQFNRKHDIILWYSIGEKWVFNAKSVRIPHKRLNTNRKGAMITKPLTPQEREAYLKKGKIPETWWPDFSPVGRLKRERLGYPTQKPLALLERIVKASSNPDGVVLDPFCGCGTTIEAAHKLGRAWVGIDISPFAIDLIQKRRMKGIPLEVRGIPQDMPGARKLARDKPFDFEKWAVCRIPGLAPNKKQVGDGGIDGRGLLLRPPDDCDSRLVLAQTKGGKFLASGLREFLGVMERDRAAMGVYITLNPVTSRDARAEALAKGNVRYGVSQYPRAQLWSIHDYFNDTLPKMPPLADPYTGMAMQGDLEFPRG